MDEDERERFNKLAAQVQVQQLVLVQLCRLHFNDDALTRFLSPLDSRIARGDPDFAESLNKELAAFRLELRKPIMGSD
ncbi:MAG: hypothetical protein OXC14_12430 [Rhodospirillaceae bacterium]|nr:hypothetical protein [Rhodospirillaceae bacterium]